MLRTLVALIGEQQGQTVLGLQAVVSFQSSNTHALTLKQHSSCDTESSDSPFWRPPNQLNILHQK